MAASKLKAIVLQCCSLRMAFALESLSARLPATTQLSAIARALPTEHSINGLSATAPLSFNKALAFVL